MSVADRAASMSDRELSRKLDAMSISRLICCTTSPRTGGGQCLDAGRPPVCTNSSVHTVVAFGMCRCG